MIPSYPGGDHGVSAGGQGGDSAGKYRVTSLFLKSNSNLELEEGAVLYI